MKVYKLAFWDRVHGGKVFDDSRFRRGYICYADEEKFDNWRLLHYLLYFSRKVEKPYEPLEVVVSEEDKPRVEIGFLPLTSIIVLNQKAVDLLHDLLEGNGTLLPLNYAGDDEYFAFRAERVLSDALDIDKCYGIEMEESRTDPSTLVPKTVRVHAFKKEKVENEHIFTIPNFETRSIFVSQEVKDRIEQSNLVTTVCFPTLWDSEDPDFIDEEFRYRQAHNWERLLAMWKEEKANAVQATFEIPHVNPSQQVTDISVEDLEAQAEIVADMLNVYKKDSQSDDLSPEKVIVWLDGYVTKLRQENTLQAEELADLGIDIATLWGELVVQKYGWKWQVLNGSYAVVAPDDSLYVLPIQFIASFFEDYEKDVTVALLFNGLTRTDLTEAMGAEAGSYIELR